MEIPGLATRASGCGKDATLVMDSCGKETGYNIAARRRTS
jgi:hypothetical protein